MSRSNPTAHNPNPAVRRFEWSGDIDGGGHFRYYDKQEKKNVDVPLPFRFIVLDSVSTVGGYNKQQKRSLYANEVRDTKGERLVVKCDKRVVAEGYWQDIKKDVAYEGGRFAKTLYVAFKDGDRLAIGSLKLEGSSLGPWFDFQKVHEKEIGTKAVAVKTFKDNRTGKNDFREPVFEIVDISKESDAEAVSLDKVLQGYFAEYFKRSKVAQAESPQASPEDDGYQPSPQPESQPNPPEEDDVPF